MTARPGRVAAADGGRAAAARYLLLRAAKEAAVAPVPRRLRLAWRLRVQRRLGIYERELDIVGRLAPAERTAVDVGANAGLYAFEMARHYARVVALEPFPEVTRDLEAARLSNVAVVHIALSDEERPSGTLLVPATPFGPVYGLASLLPDRMPPVVTRSVVL